MATHNLSDGLDQTSPDRLVLATLMVILGLMVGGCVTARYKGPVSDHFDGRVFFNPGNPKQKSFSDFLKWQFSRDQKKWTLTPLDGAGSLVRISVADRRSQASCTSPGVMFINHATALICNDGLNILTDPVWSDRTSPVSWAGPERQVPPGLDFEALPEIDVVLISHNHYDHLDLPTLRRLEKKFAPRFLVPLGDLELVASVGVDRSRIREFDWWEKEIFQKKSDTSVELTFVPAAHWSSRSIFDRNRSLWGGWYLKFTDSTVYFAGDTGAGNHFQQIRDRLGPPDLALLPIGAYEPRWFMREQHLNPADAVVAHRDLGARRSLGIHWGTWQMADEGYLDPVRDLVAAICDQKITPGEFVILENGGRVPISRSAFAVLADHQTSCPTPR